MEYRNIDEAVEKVGGRFKFSVLIQKRIRELVRGAAPLVVVEGKFNPMEVALQEVLQDKVTFQDGGGLGEDILGLGAEKEKEKEEEAEG